MSLTNHLGNKVLGVAAEVPEAAEAEIGATGTEALALTAADWADHIDLEYGAAAEDNGTAGALDGQPGLVYTGAAPTAVTVKFADVDVIEDAITPPESGDTFSVNIYKNSTAYAFSDEGYVTQDEITTWEFNGSTYMDLVEGDVIRLGLDVGGTAEVGEVDFDVSPGRIVIV